MLLGLAAAPQAQAQYPRAKRGQFEVRGLDFRARGAWRQRTANVRAQRQALLATGNLAVLNARIPGMAGPVVTGNFQVPVVPIYYSNTVPASLFTTAEYQDLFFSGAPVSRPYSLKTYYEQLSNGNITMSGTVFPWVAATNTDTYYEDGCNGVGVTNPCPNGGTRFAEMILGALATVSNGADSATVWAEFDNDGPDGTPNSGDDDGFVDFVTFLQPEVDGACGTPNIWAHRWVIQGLNGGSPYVTKTDRAGGGKIVISDYTFQSGQGGNGACTPGEIMPIGTVAHETGHAFGLPDLYDTSSQTEGIGEFGLMGSGNYARPYSPSRMEGWSLLELGWVAVDTLTTTGTITLNPVATSDTVLALPTQTPGEYFLFENRAAPESDTAQMNPAFGTHQKSPGLYIWHIDQTWINAGSFGNTVNSGAVHGVALVQADGLNQLRLTGAANNRGDTGDAYPGSTNNTTLDGYTNPGLTTNGGNLVAGRIDSIRIVGNTVLFRFTYSAPFSTAAAASDLLGVPALSAAQRTILDQDGNNNGTYDLGDFLAWVTLSGQGVPPELMARLLAAVGAPKGATP